MIWETIKGWATKQAKQYLYLHIPRNRTDATYEEEPVHPNKDYFRLWLTEMHLTKSRNWFKDWHPAVHSSVKLGFKGQAEPITLSHVARAPKEALTKAVLQDFHLTELLPYRGGIVEIEAALLAMKGADAIGATIKILENFSGLVGAPLAQALGVAGNVSTGIDELLGQTDGNVHLGFHQSLAAVGGGNQAYLKPGYYAVMLATANDVDENKLTVKASQLEYNGKPFTGYDYMLFFIERREERDDWRLPTIEQPLNNAIEAILKDQQDDAKAFRTAAIMAAFQSEDLTRPDSIRVVRAIKDELAAIATEGLGAVGGDIRSLDKIVGARAMSTADARRLPKMSLAEAIEIED